MIDPATRDGAGEILELDREARRLTLKRGPSLEDVPLPEALIPGSPYWTKDQEDALMRLGRSLLAGDRRYPALESVLRREPFDRPIQTTDLEEMKELVLSLDGRHLVIQGPPGSGKTWTSGRLIAHLLANGKRVGVASTSHKAIHNLLDAVVEAAGELGIAFAGARRRAPATRSRTTSRSRSRTSTTPTSASAPTSRPARPGSSPARTSRSTTCSSTRRGRCRSPTRSRWGRRRGTSCSSATRSSSTR